LTRPLRLPLGGGAALRPGAAFGLRWLAVATACAGCAGAGSAAGPPDAAAFPPEPYTTVTSASGALRVDVRTSPQPPSRGTNAAELTVTSTADGGAVDGLTVRLVPWMPSMNHGSSTTPTVTAAGDGRYLAAPLSFDGMPGHWELRTTFSGPIDDHATPAFDIP